MNFVVFSLLISVAFGQQLLSLRYFKGGNVKNPLNADAPYGIYVSARSDAANLLSNIYVVNADGTQISLNELRLRTVLPTSGELQVYTVEKSAYLTTTLGDQVMSILQGVMFLSSTSQLKNNSIDGTTTNAYTTTGFYMKEHGKNDSTVTVNTLRDARFTGVTGANIVGPLPAGGKVKVGEYDGDSHHEFSSTPNDFIMPWSAPAIGQTFQISSSNGAAGQFYVQYFVQQGTNTGTTPRHVETTTSSSGTVSISILVILALDFCCAF
ncbi:hypothetical protein CAEBREN_24305 [Caenorhabditis brenneri]|uniref:Uncharacterized protein n=1 Tax=Caenorhabditis brenneri TaxID=135651 RepID=G0M8X6_CAEBE|nr:hypothetical protein CAEBREN_24305 [Caenorhabditis brenneri]